MNPQNNQFPIVLLSWKFKSCVTSSKLSAYSSAAETSSQFIIPEQCCLVQDEHVSHTQQPFHPVPTKTAIHNVLLKINMITAFLKSESNIQKLQNTHFNDNIIEYFLVIKTLILTTNCNGCAHTTINPLQQENISKLIHNCTVHTQSILQFSARLICYTVSIIFKLSEKDTWLGIWLQQLLIVKFPAFDVSSSLVSSASNFPMSANFVAPSASANRTRRPRLRSMPCK